MKRLSKITKGLIGQPMFNLFAKIKEMEREGKKIIHFEIGDPDFNTPPHAIQAAKDSLDRGETHYTNSMGLWELRNEICAFTERTLGYKPSVEQVLVIPANAIIDFVVRCVANPGDEIIFPDPGFPTYHSVINYAGMKGEGIPLKEENQFRMDPEDVKKALTKKTRLVIINSPNNPAGSVMTEEEIREIAEIVHEHDIYLLTDEVYSSITYERKHFSPSVYDQCKERTIVLNSFSKIYSMSGWRLGYAIGPEGLISKLGLLLQTIISCLPPFIQQAGISVLENCQRLVEERNKELQERRDVLIKGLNSISGIKCLMPEGAFYAFANIKDTGLTGQQMADFLLEKAGVAVLNGECFGICGQGYIRMCYASTSLPMIEHALKHMKKAIEKGSPYKIEALGGCR